MEVIRYSRRYVEYYTKQKVPPEGFEVWRLGERHEHLLGTSALLAQPHHQAWQKGQGTEQDERRQALFGQTLDDDRRAPRGPPVPVGRGAWQHEQIVPNKQSYQGRLNPKLLVTSSPPTEW
jgi:hypothetical protein